MKRIILLTLYAVSMTNLLFLEAFLFADGAGWLYGGGLDNV